MSRYKCLVCGHIFELDEAARWREPEGEPQSGCPVCMSSYEETNICLRCFEDFLEDELFEGWCEDCLVETLSYDIALEYLEEESLLEEFFFTSWFGVDPPQNTSQLLAETLRRWFLQLVEDEKLSRNPKLLNACRKFILQADYDEGKSLFAQWLNERGIK